MLDEALFRIPLEVLSSHIILQLNGLQKPQDWKEVGQPWNCLPARIPG